jgi:hypothetical protein
MRRERESDTKQPARIDAFAALALAGGSFVGRPSAPSPQTDGAFERKQRRFSASHEGFDVHCAVRIAKDDDEGRERLVRYCARPPFALDRFDVLKDGRIAYRMKTPRRGSTHRVMSPMEMMARLAILVPPPFFPLTRYHGVFAARSSWRRLVTPKPPREPKTAKRCNEREAAITPTTQAPSAKPASRASAAASAAEPCVAAAASTVPIRDDAPTRITLKHWERTLEGNLFVTSPRLDWAVLLKRTHGLDALRCPRCDTAVRPIATVTEPAEVRAILTALGLRAQPLPRASARDPTDQQSFQFAVA